MRPEVIGKIIEDKHPPLAQLGPREQSGLGAPPYLFRVHLEEAGRFNEAEGLHNV